MHSVLQDIRDYERWLREQSDVVGSDLKVKHKRVRRSAFEFLRATSSRWRCTVDNIFLDFLDTPRLGCVSDLIFENY